MWTLFYTYSTAGSFLVSVTPKDQGRVQLVLKLVKPAKLLLVDEVPRKNPRDCVNGAVFFGVFNTV